MRLLLDTHLLLWALGAPARLKRKARARIEEAEVFVSAASIWEIAIKAKLGKLEADPGLILSSVEPAGFSMLSISGLHAAEVHVLPPHHRDPFDRLLIAQAQLERMRLYTNDRALAAYGDVVELAQ